LLAGSNLTNPIVLGHLHLSGAGFPGADAGAGAGRRAGGRGPCHGAGGDPAFPGHPFALPIGLNLFVTGALAWLLWPRAARETGAQPSVARASRIGAGAVPLSMAAALAVLTFTGSSYGRHRCPDPRFCEIAGTASRPLFPVARGTHEPGASG
jgi:hypothetical protein